MPGKIRLACDSASEEELNPDEEEETGESPDRNRSGGGHRADAHRKGGTGRSEGGSVTEGRAEGSDVGSDNGSTLAGRP